MGVRVLARGRARRWPHWGTALPLLLQRTPADFRASRGAGLKRSTTSSLVSRTPLQHRHSRLLRRCLWTASVMGDVLSWESTLTIGIIFCHFPQFSFSMTPNIPRSNSGRSSRSRSDKPSLDAKPTRKSMYTAILRRNARTRKSVHKMGVHERSR